MNDRKTFRRSWNTQQKELRQLLNKPERRETAVHLFLSQHAALHTAKMAQTEQATYAGGLAADAAYPSQHDPFE